MNRVCLNGRLTKDIDLRYTQNNVAVASFTLAVQRKFKNQNGDYESDFINCVAYKQTANLMNEYVRKGDLIGIEGRIQTRSYENKDGKKVYITEVIVENIDFLSTNKIEKDPMAGEVKIEPVKQKLSDDVFSDFGNSIEITDEDIAF